MQIGKDLSVAVDITLRNVNEVFVKVDCDEGIGYELRDHFTFMVPGYQFTPAYKARMWDGKIRLFDGRTKQIYRGLIPQIEEFCHSRKYKLSYENYTNEYSIAEANDFIKELDVKYDPRDYQVTAFTQGIRKKRALLLSPTASGKSLIIYLLIRYMLANGCARGLIIVPTVNLVQQLTSDFKDYSEKNGFDVDSVVHNIYAGKDKSSDKQIVISTWQSIYEQDKWFFKDFDFVIGDEAHLFKAKSLMTIMESLVNARYRIGLTGTLDGTKTHKLVLEGLFGPVYKVTSTKELMDAGHVSDFSIKCLLLRHAESVCQAAKKFKYADEIEYLVLNELRNKFIRNLAISLKGNTLILYQYVDKHGKILHDLISKKADGRKVFFIYGGTDADIREDVRKIVETEKDAIIIASYGTFSTGVNIRNLHNVIFASPSKSRVRNLQSIGRSLRKGDNKENATLYDIADDMRYKGHENFTLKHFAERLKIYGEEQFKFKIYKIEMKS